jgi:hypothetical protein
MKNKPINPAAPPAATQDKKALAQPEDRERQRTELNHMKSTPENFAPNEALTPNLANEVASSTSTALVRAGHWDMKNLIRRCPSCGALASGPVKLYSAWCVNGRPYRGGYRYVIRVKFLQEDRFIGGVVDMGGAGRSFWVVYPRQFEPYADDYAFEEAVVNAVMEWWRILSSGRFDWPCEDAA